MEGARSSENCYKLLHPHIRVVRGLSKEDENVSLIEKAKNQMQKDNVILVVTLTVAIEPKTKNV